MTGAILKQKSGVRFEWMKNASSLTAKQFSQGVQDGSRSFHPGTFIAQALSEEDTKNSDLSYLNLRPLKVLEEQGFVGVWRCIP